MSSVWDSPAPVATFFVRFPTPWQKLTGMGFGLREPALVGVVRGRLPEPFDSGEFDRVMARLTGEALPEDIAGGNDFASVVARALFWSSAVQRHSRIPLFGRAYMAPRPAHEGTDEKVLVAAPYYEVRASAAAFRWIEAALNGLLARKRLFDGRPEQMRAQWGELGKALTPFRPAGQNTFKYLLDAHQQNIPARQFLPGIQCVGIGARSRWLQSSITDRTALLASQIAGNKFTAAMVLRRAGLPAPTHALVRSAEEAVTIARKLGYPVVIKPADRQQGIGVAANLKDDAAVVAAYEEAAKSSKNILVEKHFEGTDYRMVVLDGRLLRVRGRMPGGVTGDGEHTIAELVEIRKQAPDSLRRARERGRQLLDLDEEALSLLSENGLGPNAIPAPEQYVRLRRQGNVSTGGESTMISADDVHPDNARLALRAAAALRLDFAGVDAILPDIKKSWMETGGLICEVNPQPQASTDILGLLLDGDGRIPVVLVLCESNRLDWDRLRTSVPRSSGLGFASTSGVWIGDELLARQPQDSFMGAVALLDDPRTEAAVVVMNARDVARLGLPTDRFDALVIDETSAWSHEERNALPKALEMALPHASTTVAIRTESASADFPTVDRSSDGSPWQVEEDDLQPVCERLVTRLLSPKGDTAIAV